MFLALVSVLEIGVNYGGYRERARTQVCDQRASSDDYAGYRASVSWDRRGYSLLGMAYRGYRLALSEYDVWDIITGNRVSRDSVCLLHWLRIAVDGLSRA